MDVELDIKNFKKYFHYGLIYNQEELLDAIIISCVKDINQRNLQTEKNKLEYTIDSIKSLYVQFERFIKLTADNNKNWYQNINKNTVSDVVMQRINYLKENNFISVIKYEPMYGIYITNQKWENKGEQRYNNIQEWIKEGIVPILMYLDELEQKNPYQYNSLFLDTKYARSMNSNNQSNLGKIESIYTLFMESVKPAKEDVSNQLGYKITRENQEYIEENCADYWTITNLKQQAKSDKYMEKVCNYCEEIRCQKEKDRF